MYVCIYICMYAYMYIYIYIWGQLIYKPTVYIQRENKQTGNISPCLCQRVCGVRGVGGGLPAAENPSCARLAACVPIN